MAGVYYYLEQQINGMILGQSKTWSVQLRFSNKEKAYAVCEERNKRGFFKWRIVETDEYMKCTSGD